jgi:hypothetical protein
MKITMAVNRIEKGYTQDRAIVGLAEVDPKGISMSLFIPIELASHFQFGEHYLITVGDSA